MNTIPLLFNERHISHTIMGGQEKRAEGTLGLSCLVLNRSGSQFLAHSLEVCHRAGFSEVVCVTSGRMSLALEAVSKKFPGVKLIVASEELTMGDMLNLGIAESRCEHVLVVPDDLCMEKFDFSEPLYKKLAAANVFCVCPRLVSSSASMLNVSFAPDANHAVFSVVGTPGITEGHATLYSADWAGLYSRRAYMQLGGADYTITSAYWQKLDLFMRAWLWGEKVAVTHAFSLTYAGASAVDDTTADQSYLRFYLKNLAPVFENDHAYIPQSSFFSYRSRSSRGLYNSLRDFGDARRWTAKNKYRFKTDAAMLIENWGRML